MQVRFSSTIVWVVVLTVCSAVTAFVLLRPQPVDPSLTTMSRPWGPPKEHAKTLSGATTIDAGNRERVLSVVGTAVAGVDDALTHMPSEAREALVETFAGYVGALTATGPEAYVSLSESEPTVWIGPSDRAWPIIDEAMMYLYGEPADRTRPKDVLRALLASHRFAEDRRYVRMGSDDRGLRVLIGYGRTAADLQRSLILEEDGLDAYAYWTGGGSHTIRFREPRLSPEEVVRSHGEIIFAQAAIVLMTGEGKPAVWHSTWYWDPDGRIWLNFSSWVKSFYAAAHGMYY